MNIHIHNSTLHVQLSVTNILYFIHLPDLTVLPPQRSTSATLNTRGSSTTDVYADDNVGN